MNNIRILTTTEIANRRLVWAKSLQKENEKLESELKRLHEQYAELREALVGDSPNWTHEELIEKALELIDNE